MDELCESERWLPVKTWEGVYEVSDMGQVKRVGRGDSVMSRAVIGRILTPVHIDRGYYGLTLTNGARRERPLLHQIVMLSFVGPPPPGQEVNHKDGNKRDCRLSNLEYMTHAENCQHRHKVLGYKGSQQGEKAHSAKLTELKVLEIRRQYADGGITQQQLADIYGVHNAMISMIVTRKSWTHI